MVYDYKKRRNSRGGGKRNKYGQVVTLGTNNERNKPENVKSTDKPSNTKSGGSGKQTARKRHHTDIPGIPFQMGYPIARGPGDDTGDSLMIKCVQYVPSKISLTGEKQGLYAKIDGINPVTGKEKKAGEALYNNDGQPITKFKKGTIKVSNEGASDRTKNASPIYYIRLPIPQDVNDSNVVTWGDDSMNIFQLAGVAAASNFMTGPAQTFQAAKELLNSDIAGSFGNQIDDVTQRAITSAIAGKAIDALGGNVRPNSVIGRSSGAILNSNLELLFSGVNLRTFPFSINFSPRNGDESDMVLSIIKALKSSMAAKKNQADGQTGQGGIFLRAPDVFQLRYLQGNTDHPFLNSIKDCALTGMTVNYTNSGTYATYGDGTPVSIQMNLTFKELNPIYHEDYMDAGLPGVGY
tara:strand:+ start:335 stop:1558 length:1224 start_codon:yes stop_codon:yes gene_type:complete